MKHDFSHDEGDACSAQKERRRETDLDIDHTETPESSLPEMNADPSRVKRNTFTER